jgi:hypothetical protein
MTALSAAVLTGEGHEGKIYNVSSSPTSKSSSKAQRAGGEAGFE